jgi:anti-anti-sigma factor
MAEEEGFRVTDDGDVTVIQLETTPLASAVCPWADPLAEFIDHRQPQKIVVDFQAVTSFPSMAIGALRRVDKRVREYSGQLRLCGMPRAVREVFKITKLDGSVFQIFDTFHSARESFYSKPTSRKARKHVKISQHSFSGSGPRDGTTAQNIDDYAAPSPGEGPVEPDVEFRRAGVREEKETD